MNGVIALILRFTPHSIASQADYVTVVEDRPIMSSQVKSMSVKYCLPVPVFHFWPKAEKLSIVFTALHGVQTRSYDEISVRLSVCPSVCLSVKRVHCDKTEETYV